MVRFRFGHDDPDDNDSDNDQPNEQTAIVPASDKHEVTNAVHNVHYQDSADDDAYVVVYRNGTPVLVPFTSLRQPQHSKPRFSWTFIIVVIAILMQVIRWYGPPAPPSADETWPEFLGRETGALVQALAALLSVIPHVSHWCFQSFYADVVELWLQSPPEPCSLESIHDDLSELLIHDSMIGQTRAVTVTVQALETWQKNDGDKALVLLLAGTVGLGKLRLAQLVVSAAGCHADALLQLHGRDIGGSDTNILARRIRQHTAARSGSIVVLEHPEEMPPLFLKEVLQSLPSNVIFILTTHAGSRVIHRQLKQHAERGPISSSSLLSSSFDWSLRHEIEEQLHISLSDDRRIMTAVAPFVPMGAEQLEEILKLQVRKLWVNGNGQSSLEMTEELAEAWTSADHVEYLEWKSQGRTILTFSSRGAKVMDEEIRPRLMAKLHKCLTLSDQNQAMSIQLDWDDEDEEAVVLHCEEQEGESTEQDEEELQCEELCRFGLRAA